MIRVIPKWLFFFFFSWLARKSISSFFIEDTENIGALETFITCSSLKYPTMSHMLIIKVFIFLFFFFLRHFSPSLIYYTSKRKFDFDLRVLLCITLKSMAQLEWRRILQSFSRAFWANAITTPSLKQSKKKKIWKNTQKIHTASPLSSNLFGRCISTSFIALCIPEEPPTAF